MREGRESFLMVSRSCFAALKVPSLKACVGGIILLAALSGCGQADARKTDGSSAAVIGTEAETEAETQTETQVETLAEAKIEIEREAGAETKGERLPEASIQDHRAREYPSLEEFRVYAQEGIFVLDSDAEADVQDGGSEAGASDGQGFSAADGTVVVEESYISVRYDCAYQGTSFCAWVFTEREGYEEGMLQEVMRMAGGSQPAMLELGEGKEPVPYGGLGNIYGDIFGYWAVLDQKPVIVHIEGEDASYMETILRHLRWEALDARR